MPRRPTTTHPIEPPRNTSFHLSKVFGFLCSAPLRDYLQATADRHNIKLSTMCRIALAEFHKHPRSFTGKDIGKRIIKNTPPSPRIATINTTLPTELRQAVTGYAKLHNTTISTILRRAAYEYALKLNRATDPDHKEEPQLLVDAWLHFDGRGSYKKQQAEEAKRAKTDRTIKPATKEDFKDMHVPWMKNPQRFSALRDIADDIFEKHEYTTPAPTSADPDAWVLNSYW